MPQPFVVVVFVVLVRILGIVVPGTGSISSLLVLLDALYKDWIVLVAI